ncbi:MAG: hypothetical protein R6U36_01400 [Candidatus Fermentibacteraceae bacterium]
MLTVLLLTISGLTAQAPSLQWAMEFFPDQQSHFTEVLEHSSGGYVVSGWANGACLFKISPAGVIVWQWSLDSCQTQYAYWVSELPSGDLAVTGRCMQPGETNFAPFAARVTSSGETAWQSIFDINPERDECGLSVSALPFGRLLICGYYDSFNMYNGYAYIRVVDASDGGLIWQKAWGSSSATNFALRGLWSDGVIRILAHGTDGGTGAAHVLWYDDDGYYLGRRRISAFVSYYTGQGCPNGHVGGQPIFCLTGHPSSRTSERSLTTRYSQRFSRVTSKPWEVAGGQAPYGGCYGSEHNARARTFHSCDCPGHGCSGEYPAVPRKAAPGGGRGRPQAAA